MMLMMRAIESGCSGGRSWSKMGALGLERQALGHGEDAAAQWRRRFGDDIVLFRLVEDELDRRHRLVDDGLAEMLT